MDVKKRNEQAQCFRSALKAFAEKYKELLASFNAQEVSDAFTAFGDMGNLDWLFETEPSLPVYLQAYVQMFLSLYDRSAIDSVLPVTELGRKDLERMRRDVGESGLPPESVPTPAPTSAELLEAEVRHDFATLRSDDMRRKRQSNRQYEICYQQIASTLGSSVTAVYDLTPTN